MNILDQEFLPDASTLRSSRVWSPYQETIFEAVHQPSNLLIQAVAGSGKTTTLIECTHHVSGSSLTLAFNKAIVEDYRSRSPSGDVKTLNALGHRLWMLNRRQAQLDGQKIPKILDGFLSKEDKKEFGYTLARIIGLAKNQALGIAGDAHPDRTVFEEDPEKFVEIIDAYQFDIPLDRQTDLAVVCAKAFQASVLNTQVFDFDDQLYAPLFWGWEFPQYDNVFVDECQDLSPVQHLMLEALQSRGARIVAVGDRFQAIYGFRGASHSSMDLLKKRFEMTELPLSISYRCSQEVVKEAQYYCEEIRWREGAPVGSVSTSHDSEDPQLFGKRMVLCRTNAPLFRAIMRHVKAKEPCRVLSNFLESFQSFIKHFKTQDTQELRKRLDIWHKQEIEAAKAKGFKGKIAGIEDKYETLAMFCEEYSTADQILDLLRRLAMGTSGPTFATIHKAKGLEHDSVYLLRPDLCPSPWAEGEAALQQENNLLYVAITRAKNDFTYGAPQR